MIAFDLHVHTSLSVCSNLSAPALLNAAAAAGLTDIVITDHGTTLGAEQVFSYRESNKDMFPNLRIHRGIEFRTQFGEFNAVFLSREDAHAFEMMRSKRGRHDFASLVRTITKMRDAGSQIMVGLNHPVSLSMFSRRGGFDLDGAVESGVFTNIESLMHFFDYVEANTNNLSRSESSAAKELARRYKRPVVCNTDSHFAGQVGRYFTTSDYASPCEAILAAQRGDESALILPQEIQYGWSRWYRLRSGMRKFLNMKTVSPLIA